MYNNSLFWKVFSRRSAISFFLIMLLFLSCIMRVAVTATSDYSQVRTAQNSLKITIAKQRGTIFDRNLVPITNQSKKIIAAVSPTPRAITALCSVLDGTELNNALERLRDGKPIVCEVPEKIECDGIKCTEIYTHNTPQTPSIHLVGYTNNELKGISGLQAAYDNLLATDSEIYVMYECSGTGNILEGVEPVIINNSTAEANGVVTTLDINLQSIAEKAAEKIEMGAIVIAEAKSGKIRASVSMPTFDSTAISEYLDRENSPLLNRAINAYNVGSVFKPCVAVAAIKKGLNSFSYTCVGSCEIIDRFFKCHNLSGHGLLNLRSALANSCNTYFYNLAFNVGKSDIYNTASSLRFGQELKLCEGIYTAKGSLPDIDTLDNIAQLANFSIGQGELLLSPISILTLYCAIASDGKYYIPSIVEGTLQNGSITSYNKGNPTKVMSDETAKLLREYLTAVLTEGTGKSALPKTVTAAGKTATAQTGRYESGVEICQGWFCGFFPAENPKYVAVIFSEDTRKQTASCSEIFGALADRITSFEKNRQ
ncbi:MAG: penicillin-binding protein 2 [Clostridia bacterium]|nr:penicillin-binding protein 2 [Clostridia bacterium]